jgi:hypothetical protein
MDRAPDRRLTPHPPQANTQAPSLPTDPTRISNLLLQGKVALVTGGGLGCGLAIQGMRENGPAEYGEGKTLTDTTAQIAAQYNVRAIPALGDLTRMDRVERVVTIAENLGPLHVLVHNDGGDMRTGWFLDTRAVTLFAGPMGELVTGQVPRVDGGTQLMPA